MMMLKYSNNLLHCINKPININYSSSIYYNSIKNMNNRNELNVSIINKLSRLFIDNSLKIGDNIQLDETSSHYVSNVIRVKLNQYFRIFNGKDGEFLCQVTSNSKKSTRIEILKQLKTMMHDSALTLPLTLYVAPIKKTKMKLIFEKATELGISDIVPIITQNTNTIIDNKDVMSFNKILIEASEQCERLNIAKLHKSMKLSLFLQNLQDENEKKIENKAKNILLVCRERFDNGIPILISLQQLIDENPRNISINPLENDFRINHIFPPLGILIGPEGGFTIDELNLLGSYNYVRFVSLGLGGAIVLRSETSVINALSCISSMIEAERWKLLTNI